MIDVVLADGRVVEVVATSAAVEGDELVCRDGAGNIVWVFGQLEAILYGSPEVIQDLIHDQPGCAFGPARRE